MTSQPSQSQEPAASSWEHPEMAPEHSLQRNPRKPQGRRHCKAAANHLACKCSPNTTPTLGSDSRLIKVKFSEQTEGVDYGLIKGWPFPFQKYSIRMAKGQEHDIRS